MPTSPLDLNDVDGVQGPQTLAAMRTYSELLDDTESAPQRRRSVVPAAVVLLVLLAIGVALFVGAKTLIAKATSATPETHPTEASTLVIEEYVPVKGEPAEEPEEPVELDQFGLPIPQRVPVDVGVHASTPGECSTEDLPRVNPFCDNLSDRALTDHHVADYMARIAADKIAPNSIGAVTFNLDRVFWLKQVVETPVEAGGPNLSLEAKYVEILDRWLAGDFDRINDEWQAMRAVLD